MSAAANELRYQGVFLSNDVVAEERGGRSVVTIPREDILRLELARGPAGERLGLQVAFAMLLTVIGIGATAAFLGAWKQGMPVHIELGSGGAFLPLAGFILWLAFRPRFYLRVQTRTEVRKIGFEPRAKAEEIAAFLGAARSVHGYEVEATRATMTPFR